MSVLHVGFRLFASPLGNFRNVICQSLSCGNVNFYRKVSIEEKLGIKPKPKKPQTLFIRFKTKIHPVLVKQNPNANIKELAKLAALEWKKATEKVKAELQEEYHLDFKKYQEACKDYDKTLSPAERQEIEAAKKEIKDIREKQALKKKRRELGRPKRPPSSYVMFAIMKANERGGLPFKDWQTKLANMWASLPQAEKEKFNTQYKENTEKYKKQLADWEKKMLKEGNIDVVGS